jgi:pimeloyl-ACP methyl ester carboxylesterase
MEALDHVRAPTLLIVGGRDTAVIEMNRAAQAHLRAETQLAIVPGATHLFEEPGALDEVIRLARDWFLRWFGAGAGMGAPERRPPAGPG